MADVKVADDTLKRLLDAELRAEALVEQAQKERERIVQDAVDEARATEQRFEARIPELHASFVHKAEERAAQAIAELERRYREHGADLRARAREHEREAIAAALALLIDPERD